LKAGAMRLTDSLMGNSLTIRLPENLNRWLDEVSRATGLPKGWIVKEQLERLRTAKARQPFLDLAGSVDRVPELSGRKGFGA
jgi:hypothetical protein